MLFSSPAIGCAIFVSSALFVASHPSPQSSSGSSSMNNMGSSSMGSGSSSKMTGHNGIPGHADGDDIHDGMSHTSDGSHYTPSTSGRSTNLASTDGGHNSDGGHSIGGHNSENGHSGAHHSDAHLPGPIAGWVIFSGLAGLMTLAL